MKVLLVSPNRVNGMKVFNFRSDYDFEIDGDDYGQFPPLGILYLASNLRKERPHHEVRCLDAIAEKTSSQELEQILTEFKPDVVGISTYTMVMYDCCIIAQMAKMVNPDVHVCFGGPHISDFLLETVNLPVADSVILGEGEVVFVELLDALEKDAPVEEVAGVYTKKNSVGFRPLKALRPMVSDLDHLPFPDRSLLKQDLYYNAIGFEKNIASIITSRGCPKQCTFCATMHSNYRMRSIPNVLDEIQEILDDDIKEVFFQDDTFNLLGERAKIFCREVIANNINFTWSFKARADQLDEELADLARQAGCRQIHMGVETGSQEGLDYLKKGVTIGQLRRAFFYAHKYGIRTIADWMIGLPFERTMDDIDSNFDFLLDLDPFYVQINILQPFPYTALFYEAQNKKLDDFARWQAWCSNPTREFQKGVWTEFFTGEELNEKAKQLYRKFYFRPEYIAKSVVNLASPRDFARKVVGAKKLIFNSGKKGQSEVRDSFNSPIQENIERELRHLLDESYQQ